MVSNWSRDPRDTCGVLVTGSDEFTITNLSQDLAMDCNAAADAEICDVLGTLIKILIEKGIISGTVT